MEPVTIELERVPGAAVVHVSGEIGMDAAPQLVDVLTTAQHDGQLGQCVVVDLTGVTFFSSAGIAVLSIFRTTCQTKAITLRVVPTPMIRRLLSITGAEHLVELAPTVQDGLADMPR